MSFDRKGLRHFLIIRRQKTRYEAIAALEFAEKHSGRYEKLADVYIDHTYNRRKIGDDMKTVTYFDELIGKKFKRRLESNGF